MEYIIDIMTEDDLSQVMQIEEETFADPWSLNSFRRDIKENPYSLYLTAYQGNRLAGYIGGWLIIDELHITNLAVDSSVRKQGIATALIEELIRITKLKGISRVTLEVRVSNEPAINLYKKMGFESAGCRPRYYQNNNEDALIMWKEL